MPTQLKLLTQETKNAFGDIAKNSPEELAIFEFEGQQYVIPREFDGKSMEEYETFENEFPEVCPGEYKLLHVDSKPPYKKRHTDAGYDIFSHESGVAAARSLTVFKTGLALSVPLGWYYTIEGRSGLGMKAMFPFPGTIDATYTGEMIVGLLNFTDKDYVIQKFDRIAQIVAKRQYHMSLRRVEEFSEKYDKRGAAGFGSSGK